MSNMLMYKNSLFECILYYIYTFKFLYYYSRFFTPIKHASSKSCCVFMCDSSLTNNLFTSINNLSWNALRQNWSLSSSTGYESIGDRIIPSECNESGCLCDISAWLRTLNEILSVGCTEEAKWVLRGIQLYRWNNGVLYSNEEMLVREVI